MANRIYSDRKITIIAIFLVAGAIYSLRLFYIQVIDKSYRLSANNNVLRYVTQYPARGLVYDRNGKLLVFNEAVYDLMVVARQVKDVDTNELCSLLGITREGFIARMEQAKKTPHLPSPFEKQISKETYGYVEEKLYRYPGFFVQPRTLRKYPEAIGAHILGYIGEVTQTQVDKNPYYRQGDYIGISGLERAYEEELRGNKGLKIRMVDVHNRDVGSFQGGKYDTASSVGKDLYTGLDAELQALGEKLMQNKRGSIVAIEPATGEILCFISSPGYDPNLLVGRVRGKNYALLNEDPRKPLLNRAIMGTYPPGSTFKMAIDLAGLQEGVITPSTLFYCNGPNSSPVKCTHFHQSPVNIYVGIQQSCNPYHWNVFKAIMNDPKYPNFAARLDNWRKHMLSMGFGRKLETDLSFEVRGNIPSSAFYDRMYGKNGWNAITIRSLSIGQGEILATPLQLVNYTAMVANGGWFYTPHVVSAVGSKKAKTHFTEKKNIPSIDPQWFTVARNGMEQVVTIGTARGARLDTIPVAGKTGTAENPHGKDHSLFVAYAPVNKPKIAISVIVENSGFGATWAVPIASLMIEKYLTRNISRPELEERMAAGNLLNN